MIFTKAYYIVTIGLTLSASVSDAFFSVSHRNHATTATARRTKGCFPSPSSVISTIGSSGRSFLRVTNENTEPSFSHEDLQPGDIICWETSEGSDIDVLISVLSGDDYSHSAIVGDNPPKVFEQVAFGAEENNFLTDPSRWGRRSTVTRLEDIDTNAIFDVAQADIDNEESYGFNNLAYLAVILLLNDPSVLMTDRQVVIDGVIQFIELFRAMGGMVESEESTFCSEFVFKCYDRAGIELEIHDPTIDRDASVGTSKILDLVIEECSRKEDLSTDDFVLEEELEKNSRVGVERSTSYAEAQAVMNGEASKLLKILKEEKTSETIAGVGPAATVTKIDKERLIKAVVGFALTSENTKLSKIRNSKQKVLTALNNMDKKYWVTPGELTRIKNKNAVKLGSFTFTSPKVLTG